MSSSDTRGDNFRSSLPDMHMVNGGQNRGEGRAEARPESGEANQALPESGQANQARPEWGQTNQGGQDPSLFTAAQAAHLRDQWGDLQARFVDDPRDAVSDADRLLTEALDALTSNFAQQKRRLEESWTSGGERNTEELRRTLQRYRMFFHQLVEA